MSRGQVRKKLIFTQDNLKSAPPLSGRLLGVDLGVKTIGLAISDDLNSFALPLETVMRKKLSLDFQKISLISREYEVSGYVVGWPLNADGSHSGGCDRVMSFVDEMYQYPNLFGEKPWVLLWDERFSTASVEEMVDKSVDMKRHKAKGYVDALAAKVILDGALTALKSI